MVWTSFENLIISIFKITLKFFHKYSMVDLLLKLGAEYVFSTANEGRTRSIHWILIF